MVEKSVVDPNRRRIQHAWRQEQKEWLRKLATVDGVEETQREVEEAQVISCV